MALLHRVEEGAVPLVEPHLAEHVADEDDQDGRGQPQHGPAFALAQHVAEEQEQLAPDARSLLGSVLRRLVMGGGGIRLLREGVVLARTNFLLAARRWRRGYLPAQFRIEARHGPRTHTLA